MKPVDWGMGLGRTSAIGPTQVEGPARAISVWRNKTIMQIRSYATEDREICMKIFGSDVPTYFAASDEAELARFLEGQIGPLWVLAENGVTVACGGVALIIPRLVSRPLAASGTGRGRQATPSGVDFAGR